MPSLVKPVLESVLFLGQPQPVLSVDKVRIRPWSSTDAAALVEAYEDKEIQRWHCRSMTTQEALAWIDNGNAHWSTFERASWAVEVDNHVAARITLRLDPGEGQAWASYWTVPRWRGQGIAPLALRVASEWAVSVGFHRIELEHSTQNSASCRVATKAGFSAEGTKLGAVRHLDGWHDMHVHARVAEGSSPRAPTRG